VPDFVNDIYESFPLNDAYLAMGSDEEREAEATAWSEGMIGDVAGDPSESS